MCSAIKLSSPPSTSNLVSFSQVRKLGKQQQQMAKKGKTSSWPIKFFRVILTTMLDSGEFELPTPFLKTQGKKLCKDACLKVSTGDETRMELKMSEGRAWLHKGWQDFVDKYSIQSGYFLNFQYHGVGSNFDVIIFDLSCTEVKYPVISPSTRDKHAEKIISIEDDSDDEISDEPPQKVQKGKAIMGNAKQSRKLEIANARETVLEKAKSFKSSYPHFIITMKPTYVSGVSYLYVPIGTAKRYFPTKGNRKALFIHNGEPWPMEYTIVSSSHADYAVKITKGWNEFAKGNNLKEGDVCVFDELVKRKPLEFNITIFPNADEEEVVKTKTSAKKETRRPEVLKSVESSRNDIRHFSITITPTYTRRASVPVPAKHAKVYLKEDEKGKNFIKLQHGLDGRSWKVEYCHRRSRPCSDAKKFLLNNGWMSFLRENHLQKGDIVNFKRMSGKAKAYEFTIIRLADHA